MVVSEMKRGMCGHRFEIELLDREDPKEKHFQGHPVRCPQCGSMTVETVCVLRRESRQVS